MLQSLLDSHLCVCVSEQILSALFLTTFLPQPCGFDRIIFHSVIIFSTSNVCIEQNWLYILRSHHIPLSRFSQFFLLTKTNQILEQRNPLMYSVSVSLLGHRAGWRRSRLRIWKDKLKVCSTETFLVYLCWFLVPCCLKCGSGISTFSIFWEPVKNAEYWASPQNYWI